MTTPAEAKAAYNNLNNLRLECRSCNASHDWE
ncbi:GH-E family nuclease [Nocardia sp. NPDC052001]